MPGDETEQNRITQKRIADAVLRANPQRYDDYIWLSPFGYRIDGVFWRKLHWYQSPRLFFEAKPCNKPYQHYDRGFMVEAGKLFAAEWLLQTTGLQTAVFVEFSDGIIAGALLLDKDGRVFHNGKWRITGRPFSSRNRDELAPYVDIPWDKWKVIFKPADLGDF